MRQMQLMTACFAIVIAAAFSAEGVGDNHCEMGFQLICSCPAR